MYCVAKNSIYSRHILLFSVFCVSGRNIKCCLNKMPNAYDPWDIDGLSISNIADVVLFEKITSKKSVKK